MATEGLERRIKRAYLDSSGLSEDNAGNIPELAKDVTDAIVDFLTEQTFTITKMKASLEVEELKLGSPIDGDVAPSQTAGTYKILLDAFTSLPAPIGSAIKKLTNKIVSMIPKTFGKGEVSTKIDWTKNEGMESSGHAYIGREASRVPNSDTVDEWNNFTEVKLDPNKIVGQ